MENNEEIKKITFFPLPIDIDSSICSTLCSLIYPFLIEDSLIDDFDIFISNYENYLDNEVFFNYDNDHVQRSGTKMCSILI